MNDITFKDVINLFRLKKENDPIKFRIIRNIRHVFEYEEENCYNPLTVGGFWSNNNIDKKQKGDRNKMQSIENIYIKWDLKDT